MDTETDKFIRASGRGVLRFDDPFFEEGDLACGLFKRMCVFDNEEEEFCHSVSKEFFCDVPGCLNTFETLLEFEVHYRILHQYVCSVCSSILPSSHLLDLHIQEKHDSFFSLQAEQKPMYQCFVEECKTKFQTVKERKDHCVNIHSFPRNYRWFVLHGNTPKSAKLSKPSNVDAEMGEDSMDAMPTEAVMEGCSANETRSRQSKKKQKHKQREQGIKSITMDIDTEDSACSSSNQEDTPSNPVDLTKNSKEGPAPFRGFSPRNPKGTRAFSQKSYFKQRAWHQPVPPSSKSTSLLESGNLTAELQDSLPTDMDDT